MADQQDQLSSGGSVETASASADTSKVRRKSSSSGSSGYRKRQSTGSIPVTLEEKRRRQTIGDPQSSEVFNNTSCKHSSESTGIRTRGEFKGHGSGLESYLGNYIFLKQYEHNPYILFHSFTIILNVMFIKNWS